MIHTFETLGAVQQIPQEDLKFVKGEDNKVRNFYYGHEYGRVYVEFGKGPQPCIPKGWNNENHESLWLPCDCNGNVIEIYY